MSTGTLNLDDTLYQYMLDASMREHPLLEELRAANRQHPRKSMQIAPEQGQFMAMLVKLMGAHRALEIGVFTGYSTLSVALALPESGQLIACDCSKEYTDVANDYWRRAGVSRTRSICGWHLRWKRSTRWSPRVRPAPSISLSSMRTRKTTLPTMNIACSCCIQAGCLSSTTYSGAAA